MGSTADKILDSMQHLIQSKGFNAVSYQDIADEVGIRKASIHHHFPTKFKLGQAVIARYRLMAEQAIAEAGDADPVAMLESYTGLYLYFGHSADMVCLCGALAGEFLALPAEMQAEVARFFQDHQDWLESVLEKGRRQGVLAFDGSACRQARLFFSALQGALLVKRSNGDLDQLRDVIEVLMKGVIVRDDSA
jgi:TetR/AcrR family transcriptional repressor of nem operon